MAVLFNILICHPLILLNYFPVLMQLCCIVAACIVIVIYVKFIIYVHSGFQLVGRGCADLLAVSIKNANFLLKCYKSTQIHTNKVKFETKKAQIKSFVSKNEKINLFSDE